MHDLLATVSLDMDEVLDDLYVMWQDNREYSLTPTAFHSRKLSGEWIMSCCPFHSETNPSFGVLVNYPYTFSCFGCGAYGDIGKLVAHVLGHKSELAGLQYIRKNYTVASASDRKKFDMGALLEGGTEQNKKRTLPDSEASKYTKKRHDYIVKRGFRDRTLVKYEVGYDEEAQAITFPVRTSKGLLRFINRRSVHTKSFLNEKEIYKKDILYGLYYILQAPLRIEEIYLNESIVDTMSCYESGIPACSVMGRILFKEQVHELLLAGIKQVNLFFDNDMAGVHCTLASYALLAKTPIKVNVVIYPKGHYGIDSTDTEDLPYKDANDLLIGKAMRQIEIIPFLEFKSRLSDDVIDAFNKARLKTENEKHAERK